MSSQRHTDDPEQPEGVTRRAPAPRPDPPDPLLAAARACVLEVGLRRTTLADVARRAGVSRMTVYRQYGDLQSIVGDLLTTELLGLIEQARQEVAALPSARARLVDAAVRVVGRLAVHPLWCKVLDLDPELLIPLVVDRFGSSQRVAVDQVAEQVVLGQREGSIREGDPQLLATCALLTAQSFVFSARVIAAEHKSDSTG